MTGQYAVVPLSRPSFFARVFVRKIKKKKTISARGDNLISALFSSLSPFLLDPRGAISVINICVVTNIIHGARPNLALINYTALYARRAYHKYGNVDSWSIDA